MGMRQFCQILPDRKFARLMLNVAGGAIWPWC